MKDPMRLDEGEATPFERQLLEAAKQMAPGPALKARMQEQLGLLDGMPVSGPGMSTGMGWLPSIVLTLASIGVVVSLPLASRAIHGSREVRPAQENSSPVDRSASAPPPAIVPAFEAPIAAPQAPPRASSADSPPRAKERPLAVADKALKEEIRILDRVRAAMVAGQPRRGLAELERYGRRFPRGAFRPEAMVLRIEALDAAGESQNAKALGRYFLAHHPESPLSDRVAAIVHR
jgi:hypothetical protein